MTVVGGITVVVRLVIGGVNCNTAAKSNFRNSNSGRVSDCLRQGGIFLSCAMRHYLLTLESHFFHSPKDKLCESNVDARCVEKIAHITVIYVSSKNGRMYGLCNSWSSSQSSEK